MKEGKTMEPIIMNAASDKQRVSAMNVRADALNSLEQFRSIFADSNTFYGKNLFAIYNAGRNLILSYTDAASILDHAASVADETKSFASMWEQHYNFCKQHGKKPHSAKFILKHADPSALHFRYLTAELIEKEMEE